MSHIIIEIKAKCSDHEPIRQILLEKGADFRGTDHQIDTYFKVPNGRLKLREGNIENTLIHYQRENKEGPKQSEVTLYYPEPDSSLGRLLENALGVLVRVDKQREIYFIDNVKFHLDTVKGLGSFIEIEAIDMKGNIGREKLWEQCRHYMALFGVKEENLVPVSYSDLLLG
jgi:adenylate cyclase class 2